MSQTNLCLWFEADGYPWLVLGLQPTKFGTIKCRNLINSQIGYFKKEYVDANARIAGQRILS